MFFVDKLDLIPLAFRPQKGCFSMAQVEWRGYVLNAPLSKGKPIVDLSSEELTDLMTNLYGSLGLIEITDLFHEVQNIEPLKKNISWAKFFAAQGMQYNERLSQLLQTLAPMPSLFKSWAFQKKASASDLMPLNSLKNQADFMELSPWFAELHLTRNEGRKTLDTLVDLILMGHSVQDLLPQQGGNWLDQLQKIRYPKTYNKDSKAQIQISQWPEYVQIQKGRQGDRRFEKMQIQYFDKQDLKQKLSRINDRVDINT